MSWQRNKSDVEVKKLWDKDMRYFRQVMDLDEAHQIGLKVLETLDVFAVAERWQADWTIESENVFQVKIKATSQILRHRKLFSFRNADGKYGFKDIQGNIIIAAKFDGTRSVFSFLGRTPVRIGNKKYLIDTSGAQISQPFDHIRGFVEGNCAVRVSKGWGFIDGAGQWVARPAYEKVYSFTNGMALIKDRGLWGFIGRNGEWALPAKYSAVGLFSNERAVVKTKERGFGYIDTSGEFVIAPQFASASNFRERRAPVTLFTGEKFYIVRYGRKIAFRVDPPPQPQRW
jgi:hypothetical protein